MTVICAIVWYFPTISISVIYQAIFAILPIHDVMLCSIMHKSASVRLTVEKITRHRRSLVPRGLCFRLEVVVGHFSLSKRARSGYMTGGVYTLIPHHSLTKEAILKDAG